MKSLSYSYIYFPFKKKLKYNILQLLYDLCNAMVYCNIFIAYKKQKRRTTETKTIPLAYQLLFQSFPPPPFEIYKSEFQAGKEKFLNKLD